MLYQDSDNHETERERMPKSKLECYEDLMAALVDRYLSIDSLAFACNMDCVAVNQRLGFLIKNGLAEEKRIGNKRLYALTKRGIAIQKTLAITKRLEKLKTTVKAVDEALVAVSRFSEQDEEPRR
jgi:predicted transcriptional regulator